jgi:hypothetical protein
MEPAKTYRFTLIGVDGSVQSTCTMQSTSEDGACEIGTELLLSSECQTLEVWRGSVLIFRVVKAESKNQKPRFKPGRVRRAEP